MRRLIAIATLILIGCADERSSNRSAQATSPYVELYGVQEFVIGDIEGCAWLSIEASDQEAWRGMHDLSYWRDDDPWAQHQVRRLASIYPGVYDFRFHSRLWKEESWWEEGRWDHAYYWFPAITVTADGNGECLVEFSPDNRSGMLDRMALPELPQYR